MQVATSAPLVRVGGTLVDINTFYEGQSGGSLVCEDVLVVLGELDNVIGTPVGTEWQEPLYGSHIPDRTFEPVDTRTAWFMKHDLEDATRRWVPQIVIDSARTRVTPYPDQRLFIMEIALSIPQFDVSVAYTVAVKARSR